MATFSNKLVEAASLLLLLDAASDAAPPARPDPASLHFRSRLVHLASLAHALAVSHLRDDLRLSNIVACAGDPPRTAAKRDLTNGGAAASGGAATGAATGVATGAPDADADVEAPGGGAVAAHRLSIECVRRLFGSRNEPNIGRASSSPELSL